MLMPHVVHGVVTCFAIIFLMLVFESITRCLKQERAAESDRHACLAAHDNCFRLCSPEMEFIIEESGMVFHLF